MLQIIGFDTETILTPHIEVNHVSLGRKGKISNLELEREALALFFRDNPQTSINPEKYELEESGYYEQAKNVLSRNEFDEQVKTFTYDFYSAQFFAPQLELNLFTTDPAEVESIFSHKTRNAIFLASNAEYDFTVLAKIIDKQKFKLRCLYNGSRFLYGKLQRGRHMWTIYDLRNIFTGWSLAKMGKFLKIEKLEKPAYFASRSSSFT